MDPPSSKVIFSIGHSNHDARRFFDLLRAHGIRHLVDVRSIPSSGRFPQFKRKALEDACRKGGISYRHCPQLGNKVGGIAKLLQLPEGEAALFELATAAESWNQGATAYMCAEGPWRECHRQVVAQQLVAKYQIWTTHILPNGLTETHPEDHLLPAYYGVVQGIPELVISLADPPYRPGSSTDALCEPCTDELLDTAQAVESGATGQSAEVSQDMDSLSKGVRELGLVESQGGASSAEAPPARARRWGRKVQ
mmetsp:Transcript_36504/g.66910  ORF Transcript_36504/g.66910 Transcript_36504/m.66910 type:complete len:252 (+) Transcript_36504:43-798(+)